MSLQGTPEEFESRPPGRIRPLPEQPMQSLGQIEKYKRQGIYGQIQGQISRIEMIGTDDQRRLSYHKYPFQDGTRQVLFYGSIFIGVGRCFRLIVNDEFTRYDDGRELHASDYVINAYKDVITKQSDVLIRGHHDNRWSGLDEIQAPFMRVKNQTVSLGMAPDYELKRPFHERYSLLEQMDMTQYMQEALVILTQLNKVTREDGVTNE